MARGRRGIREAPVPAPLSSHDGSGSIGRGDGAAQGLARVPTLTSTIPKTVVRRLCIVPAHNEAASLPALLDEIRQQDLDVVVINDASTDATEAVARAAAVPVVTLPINLGIGGAVQTGFIYALRHEYDVVVQIDGDGQHDPRWVPGVVAPIETGAADCVIGSRYIPGAADLGYRTPLARQLGMRFSTKLLQLATGLQIHDTTSGLRALN